MATRSTVTIIAASLAIGIAAGLGIGKVAFSPEPTPDAFMVQCVSVYDGDTISVEYRGNVEKVRLLGIECVEMKKGKKLAAQAKKYRVDEKVISQLGRLAKAYTSKQTLEKDVDLVFPSGKEKRDGFGRLLAYVEVNGNDSGEKLLTYGQADLYPAPHSRQEHYRRVVDLPP